MVHFTREKRYQLEVLLRVGLKQETIALFLDLKQSSISREIRRNGSPKKGKYSASRAHQRALERRKQALAKRVTWDDDPELLREIIQELRDKKSPRQITGRRKQQKKLKNISHQTLYTYIKKARKHGGSLHLYLRYQGRKFKWRGVSTDKTQIPNRKGIEERPEIVNTKGRHGDWESDLIVSPQSGSGATATFVERTTMKLGAIIVKDKSADELVRAAHFVFTDLPPELRRTMTHDNGKEATKHEQITEELGIEVYFARPYKSCDRGLNEWMNRELRRFFPKGTDFAHIEQHELDHAVDWLNNCPRETLGFRTPNEVFDELVEKYAFQT